MIKAVKCLAKPGSEEALDKIRVILFRGSSQAEEAERWFSVKSSLLPVRIQVPSSHIWDLESPLGDADLHQDPLLGVWVSEKVGSGWDSGPL